MGPNDSSTLKFPLEKCSSLGVERSRRLDNGSFHKSYLKINWFGPLIMSGKSLYSSTQINIWLNNCNKRPGILGGIEEFCQPQMGSTKEGNNLKRESRHSKKKWNSVQRRREGKGSHYESSNAILESYRSSLGQDYKGL